MAVPSPYSNTTNLQSIVPTPDFVDITPDDTATLTYNGIPNSQCKGLFIGAAGDVIVVNSVGQAVPFTCTASTTLPVQATRVLATGTTASAIVAFF